jgi:hypothetical protein
LLVGNVAQAEGDPVDEFGEAVDAFGFGVGDPEQDGVGGGGQGDEFGDVLPNVAT